MENDFSEWWSKNSPATGSNSDSQNPSFSPSPTPPSQSPTHPPILTPTPNRPQGFYPYNPGYFSQFSPGIGYQPAYSPAFTPVPSFSPPPIIPAFESLSPYDNPRPTHPIYNLGDDDEPAEDSSATGGIIRGGRGGRRGSRGGRRGGRTGRSRGGPVLGEGSGSNQYSEQETLTLARVWVDISEDPISSNNQKVGAFWGRIQTRYNAIRPPGTAERDSEKLRNHWKRVSSAVKLFEAKYVEAERGIGSGGSKEDILTEALQNYQELTNKAFRYHDTWDAVRLTPKFLSGAASGDAIKRCKTSIDGGYTTSSERDPTPSSDGTESVAACSYMPRPEGIKAAQARGKKKVFTSDEGSTASKAAATLAAIHEDLQISTMYDIITKDVSEMTPDVREKHEKVVALLLKRLEK